MSTTLMTASCDSIGSCSLDVDIEADSQAGVPPPGAVSLSEATLHSLLLSAPSGADVDTTSTSPSTNQAKKPSYLNLACSISGYGGITTYDSKLREGFRSRDHSPGRLLVANGATREESPGRAGSRLLEPPSSGRRCWTPSPVSGQPGRGAVSAMKHVSPTMTSNGTELAKRFTEQRSKWLESAVTSSSTSDAAASTTIETRIEAHSNATSVSTTVITTSYNSCSERVYGGDTPPRSGLSNGSSAYQTPVSSKKSFIQQRVERLYGPGALAQGFFHRSGKSPTSSSPSSRVHNINITKISDSPSTPVKTPELPVLRHLRPEFREQLPVVGGATRKSFGIRTSPGSPLKTSPQTRNENSRNGVTPERNSVLRGSTESLADLQPAAPEVVLPVEKGASPPEPAKVAPKEPPKEPRVAAAPPAEPFKPSPRINGSTKPKKTAEPPTKTEAAAAVPTNYAEPADDNPGYSFLKLQRQEIEILLKLAEGAEAQMEASVSGTKALPEEALGHLRAAAGQARLLVRQKMVQFEGLCRKSMSQAPDEPFPTTPEDLQGFWDMVLLQVKQVHNTFARLERLRAVNWDEEKLPPEERADTVDAPAHGGTGDAGKSGSGAGARKPTRNTRATKATTSAPSAEAAAKAADARKAREEQRRKMMEERRKQVKKQQQGEVEIFAPDAS